MNEHRKYDKNTSAFFKITSLECFVTFFNVLIFFIRVDFRPGAEAGTSIVFLFGVSVYRGKEKSGEDLSIFSPTYDKVVLFIALKGIGKINK